MKDRTTPAINGLPDKLPSESPPLLENKIKNLNHHEEAQWLGDTTTSAEIMLQHMETHHVTTLSTDIYIHHPFVNSQQTLLLMIYISVIKEMNMTDNTDIHFNIVSYHQNQPHYKFQLQIFHTRSLCISEYDNYKDNESNKWNKSGYSWKVPIKDANDKYPSQETNYSIIQIKN